MRLLKRHTHLRWRDDSRTNMVATSSSRSGDSGSCVLIGMVRPGTCPRGQHNYVMSVARATLFSRQLRLWFRKELRFGEPASWQRNPLPYRLPHWESLQSKVSRNSVRHEIISFDLSVVLSQVKTAL